MNTKSLLTRIGVPVLSLGLLGGLGATLATSASAAVKPPTVTANTHLNNHPDTTGLCGVGVVTTDCVWAYDNATEKFTMVQQSDGSWTVTMDYVGSFHGFADPRTTADPGGNGLGAALDSNGSVKGTISYRVTSPNMPDPSLLPSQSASDAHLGDNIRALFGNDPATVVTGGDHYTFTYHQIAGQDYTQVA
jgi:hypothetical protein